MILSVALENSGIDDSLLESLLGEIAGSAIEIVLIDPGWMRVLNRKYRHIDRQTDVLTFDMSDAGSAGPEGVIYVDGRLFPPVEPLLERIFHGYLHLCGYSHDDDDDSERMNDKVRQMIADAMERRAGP